MEEESSEDTQTSEFTHDDCNNIGNEIILSNENHHTLLYSGRKYELWEACENFIIMWAKQQGFQIIKDRVRHCYKKNWLSICCHPSRWYDDNKDVKKAMQEPFLVADKFIQENITYNYDGFSDSNMTLCLFNQYNNEFCEDRLTIMEQKLIYRKLYGMYKKALNKALGSNSKSEQLINLLQEFTEDGESDFEELNEINETNPEDEIIDKENVDPLTPILRNLKKRSGNG
ncbi:unnamed protein product [Rhizophagus irregularis]|uniref:Uncharacterized protein n=1 Tax=Rhizophagus irregularis TaxID=588596 RepID=A0A915ZR54_9GLOM|nr:unnamed protein product [Rhizophagus irregularis]